MACGLAVAVLAAGCGSPVTPPGGDTAVSGDVAGELFVFAAASLTDAFERLGEAFVRANPDVEVVFNHAGSQTLASQIDEGAPADVFASANPAQMDAVAAGLTGRPETFTGNRLAIAVEPGNPHDIGMVADLADPALLVVLPAADVPAGRYAREVLDAAGVEVAPVSSERDVRAALAKVELGEADASIVYASDLVAAGGSADAVEIAVEQNVSARYPIAVLAGARNPTAARAFVDFVLSAEGQEILAEHGFTAP